MWIRLHNIQIFAHHGVHQHEREFGGNFELDVEVRADLERAAKSDALGDTLDYTGLYQTIIRISSSTKYNLLEAWASRLAHEIAQHHPRVQECIVRIRKPGAAIGGILDTVEVEYQFPADA
jgi:dihydroneopterin aldolase